MPIEPSVNWFSDYDINQPQDGDDLVEGDNHIRNLKKSILAQFPGLGDVAMNCTAAELNTLDGITASTAELNLLTGKSLASADDVIDNFPSGTKMVFNQAAAPTGWTQDVTAGLNDSALRVVNTAGGGAAGANGFATVLNASVNVSGTALTTNQIPAHSHGAGTLSAASNGAHTHTYSGRNEGLHSSGSTRPQLTDSAQTNTPSTNSAGAHTHTVTGSTANNSTTGSTHNHNFNLDVKYNDVILCTKD
jgi:hypothetical protein